mgnify:CR=1 FL=1
MKAFFRVLPNGSLIPNDEETRLYISRRKPGDVLGGNFTQSRNYENHKRFFSFLETTFAMQEHFDQSEAYRYWLTMKAGWFDTIVAPNGNTIFKAKSIDFASMDEFEFKGLFSAVIDVFLKELGNGLTENELMKAISYG